jgi:small subunit ribosomal protein S4
VTKILSSKYKASRRLGVSIWGDHKDPVHKNNTKPGQHGANNMAKVSDYGVHLKAKQRIKCHYGPITEKQFRNTFKKAYKMKGNSAENFLGMLERRLDAVVYRMNLAPTIFSARQLVSHKHIKVNGKYVNIPSYMIKVGDIIEMKESSREVQLVAESVSKQSRRIPDYIKFDVKSMSGKMTRIPVIADVPFPFEPEFNMIVELYSR